MKIKYLFGWAVGLSGLFSAASMAEIPLKDASEIVGTWRLESVSPALDKPKIEENRIWEFRNDGIVVTSGYNRHFKMNDRHEWSYHVAQGKLIIDDPGRLGKTIDYAVHQKDAAAMILKGGIEGFYFFKKQ